MIALRRLLFYLCWPGLFLYFFRSRRSRVLIRYGQEVLLVKGWWERLFADPRWSLPGGGKKRHETDAQGAVRELAEELGIQVAADDLEPLGEAMVHDDGISYRAVFFLLEPTDRPQVMARSYEVQAMEWVRLETLPAEFSLKPEVILARHRLSTQD